MRVIAIKGRASLWKREVRRDFTKGCRYYYETVNKSIQERDDARNHAIGQAQEGEHVENDNCVNGIILILCNSR